MTNATLSILEQASKELYPLITKEFSDQSSKKYNDDKWTLSELDDWRNIELPKSLRNRKDTKEGAHLKKDELVLLMDWKLAKGKFRPTLPKLIKSNDADSVLEITKSGFAIFIDFIESLDVKNWSEIQLEDYKSIVRDALKQLCLLKGVGPATGSLLLSLLLEITKFAPPFFSDESYMYFIQGSLHPSQPIKYTVKEYVEELIPVMVNVCVDDERLTPCLLEKGGWSLKMYHMYKIDCLADINLPFEINDSIGDHFDESAKYLDRVKSEKRPGNAETNPAKRKKRN